MADSVRSALLGKAGIVTGASRGLGRAFVTTLVERGARVACLARPSSELDALTAKLGEQALRVPCDVGDASAVNAAVAATAAAFTRIDFVINNAGIFKPFLLEEATDEEVVSHLATNLLGPIWIARAAIPHLKASKGHLVAISSEAVRMPYPMLSIYNTTKAGLEMLSSSLREELRADGIRVTTLRSGQVAGSSGTSDIDPQRRAQFLNTIEATGHAAFTGSEASQESMAADAQRHHG